MKNEKLKKLNSLYISQKLDAFVFKTKKEIEELREKWLIPIEAGFNNENDFFKWQDENLNVDKYISKYPKIKNRDRVLLTRIFVGVNREDNEVPKKYQISKTMCSDIKNLIKRNKMSSFYLEPIIGYILFGSFDLKELSKQPIFIDFDYKNNILKSKNYLPIKIYPDTTIKDIQMIWPEVEKLKEEMFGISKKARKKVSQNYERDKRVIELKNIGMSYKQIAKTISKEYKIILIDTDISPIIKRFKKKYKLDL